ncbi:hypothetical protein CH306_25885 [Rhodococcus sp. 15-725-2-2b]|uniref:MlaD family protein n=1 Tax=unclassified Rhodococcus (in: high G+C Gram-positive bacteria) TaxID=192944 RepID=UPI000B9AD21B|nr:MULTISPECIES: MlaD family protein [unclassified Rhodococcus (in: high G+C Gram-positive bacteria)]OZC63667.1 hypothetical protein CH277_22775 [Rhodococcus sp. 06-469-3-2]OZD40832.1 hypothetical protein CH264_24460 [Rhodococcus sp. 06-1477-1A]OZE67060.1 hypothetical protein CH306_25885 [Rhodococcus sp. 15-725-2-2b]
MPSLTRRPRRVRDFSERQHAIGLFAIVVTLAIIAAATYVYLEPPGQQVVSFESTDVASLKTGADVRVAGVSVGSVDELVLGENSVEVRAKIDDSVFVGDTTSVDVRLLTAVGGYYVTLLPNGKDALDGAVIPQSRVSVPYSIADVLQQAPRITDAVDPVDVSADIEQVASGLSNNAQSVGSVISGLDSIAEVMNHQREQITTTLNLAQSYVHTFNVNREYVFALMKKIELVLARYNATWQGFNETYQLLGEILERVSPIAWFYYDNRARVKEAVTTLRTGFRSMQEQMNPVIDQLTSILTALRGIADRGGPDDVGKNVILASDVCVPLPGKGC